MANNNSTGSNLDLQFENDLDGIFLVFMVCAESIIHFLENPTPFTSHIMTIIIKD
jgi:hypothetical protein